MKAFKSSVDNYPPPRMSMLSASLNNTSLEDTKNRIFSLAYPRSISEDVKVMRKFEERVISMKKSSAEH